MAHVSVIIDGKTYRMACKDGQEEHLRGLGQKMDEAIQTMKGGFGDVGDQRLAIMAGIMMADQLSENEQEVRGLRAEVETLKESRNALIERYHGAESTLVRALHEVTDRVTALTNKLNGGTGSEPTTVDTDKTAK